MIIGVDARSLIDAHLAGIGTYLDRVLKEIAKIDSENTYYLYCQRPPVNDYSYGKNFSFKVVDGKVGSFWLRYKLPNVIKKDGIDVFWGPEHTLPRPVKGIRYVLTVHDMVAFINHKWSSFITNVMLRLYGKKSIKEADDIIAISTSTKNDIGKYVKVDSQKIHVVHNGGYLIHKKIDISKDELLKKFSLNENYFLFIGTLEPRKNITVVIDAFEKFMKDHNNIDLVIAGKIGWKFKKIIEKLDNSPNASNIKRIGYVSYEEKIALYQNAIAFLFPSCYEGFGLPIIEALSLSCPVIANNVSSMPEIGGDVVEYIAGSQDIEGLCKSMDKIFNLNDDELKLLKIRGLKQAEKFTWEKCGQQTHKILIGE